MALTAWRTFVEVCDSGSLTAASHKLGYTQSAISRQVAALELDLGETLLDRLPRGVRPTPAGLALLPHARLVVGEADRARQAVRRARDGDPVRLTLGAVPSASVDLVPRVLRGLPSDGPRVTLRSGGSAELHERVRRGDVDLAVVTDYPPGLPTSSDVLRTRLLEDEMCVLLPAGHLRAGGRRRARLSLFADEVWAEDDQGSGRLLEQAAERGGFAPRVELVAGDLLGKVSLVAAGLAVALVPSMLVPGLPAGVVVRRLVDPPTRTVYAVSRTPHPRPGVAELTAALVETASTLAG